MRKSTSPRPLIAPKILKIGVQNRITYAYIILAANKDWIMLCSIRSGSTSQLWSQVEVEAMTIN